MRTTSIRLICHGILIILPTSGCLSTNGVIGGDMRKGIVLVLPGAEGQSTQNEQLAKTISNSDLESIVILRDWTRDTRGMVTVNQRSRERNRKRARQIASYLTRYREQFPGGKVQIVGHSAGAAMAIYVAEAMSDDSKVDAIYLLSPSLSPKYDLTTALRNTKEAVYSFSSRRDWIALAGNFVVGTVDGHHEPAAGWCGFIAPSATDSNQTQQYEKLIQLTNSDLGEASLTDGSHFGWTTHRFVRNFLAPLIIAIEESDGQAGTPSGSPNQFALSGTLSDFSGPNQNNSPLH